MVWFYLLLALAVLATLILLAYRIGAQANPASARADFLANRAELQRQFFSAAAASGKPRGLVWKSIDWGEGYELARELATRRLTVLASITIHFEAIEGGDMEGVAAVGLPRNASAVFFHHAGQWATQGKAVFNLNPDEVLAHFAGQYERLQEVSK